MRPNEAAGSPVVPKMKSRRASAVVPFSSPVLIHSRVAPTVASTTGDLESTASASLGRGMLGAGGAFGVLGSEGLIATASVGDAVSEVGAGIEAAKAAGFGVRGFGEAGAVMGMTALVFGTAGGTKGTGTGAVVLMARGNSCLARSTRTGSTARGSNLRGRCASKLAV